jgi:phosphotransferase system HPr (HPr) family protein
MTVSASLKILHEVGLHARPASVFVETASAYQSEIQVTNITNGKGPVNAKSVLSVLTLGVEKDFEIEVTANGPDEQEALEALTQLIQENFGEA